MIASWPLSAVIVIAWLALALGASFVVIARLIRLRPAPPLPRFPSVTSDTVMELGRAVALIAEVGDDLKKGETGSAAERIAQYRAEPLGGG